MLASLFCRWLGHNWKWSHKSSMYSENVVCGRCLCIEHVETNTGRRWKVG